MADEHGTADWPIRHALDRLVAQDSWERPDADAAREALDELAAREQTLRQALEQLASMQAFTVPFDLGGPYSGEYAKAELMARIEFARAALAADAPEPEETTNG